MIYLKILLIQFLLVGAIGCAINEPKAEPQYIPVNSTIYRTA